MSLLSACHVHQKDQARMQPQAEVGYFSQNGVQPFGCGLHKYHINSCVHRNLKGGFYVTLHTGLTFRSSNLVVGDTPMQGPLSCRVFTPSLLTPIVCSLKVFLDLRTGALTGGGGLCVCTSADDGMLSFLRAFCRGRPLSGEYKPVSCNCRPSFSTCNHSS
jgi:hypothetical protein